MFTIGFEIPTMSKRTRRETFMDVQITDKQYWLELDSSNGTWFTDDTTHVPTKQDVRNSWDDKQYTDERFKEYITEEYKQYCENANEVYSVRKIKGYGVRLSAAGYMDCTDWEVYTNKREAMRRARELDRENQDA
jgi:uncharacterized protein (UPF0297 family)